MKAILLVALVVIVVPAPAMAQADDGLMEVLRTTDEDDYIRLTLADGSIEGRITDLDEDSVRLADGAAALLDIRLVEERHRSGSGALIGAIAGGAALTAVLLPFAGFCSTDCGGAYRRLILVGVTVGSVVGGLVGAVFDSADETWEERWRAAP